MFTSAKQQQSGFALVDALVGTAIASIVCISLLSSIYHARIVTAAARDQLSASSVALETYEVAVAMTQADYSAFLTNTAGCTSSNPCHMENNGTSWSVSTGSMSYNTHFTVSFYVTEVYRDASSHTIVTSGGTLDTDTTEITISVDWTNQKGIAKNKTLAAYLHNIDL